MRPPPTFRARQPCANSSRTFCSYRGSRYADCYSSARALFDWPRCPACRSTVSEPPVPIPQHRKRSAVLPPARNVPWDSPFSIASGNRVALFSQMFTGHIIEKALLAGAPLRNRTVDLLLTMNDREVPGSQVRHVTRKNTSSRQPPQAPDRHPLAPIATQSATQFDLMQVRGRRAGEAVKNRLEPE